MGLTWTGPPGPLPSAETAVALTGIPAFARCVGRTRPRRNRRRRRGSLALPPTETRVPTHVGHPPTCSPPLGRIRICFSAVPSWKVIDQTEPEFALRVRRLMDAGRHKTIATLRADGSPRISGIECEFTDTDLSFGSMTGARKSADLERDPRFALHGPTFHPEEGKEKDWPGEAKVAGRAIPPAR